MRGVKAIMAMYKQLTKNNKLFHTDSMKFPIVI